MSMSGPGTSPLNVTQQLVASHLVAGTMRPGEDAAIRVDQTLSPDSGGTLMMLELEAMGADLARTDVSVQYVDHNLLQADERNAADHEFLRSAARRFGFWYSGPGNGISHVVHMQNFGRPGRTLLGVDSHTCAAGSLGMLALGAGGIDVARAVMGEPVRVRMPGIWGIRLHGRLAEWVSAKDVILELLRRHGVDAGLHRVIEYHGPGLAQLTAMDRHVIASMGAELGATSSVFPADEQVRDFLDSEGRPDDFTELVAEPGSTYDHEDELDLSTVEPLIALPGSPGNVVPVREVQGVEVGQVVIGSSANPGLRDYAVVAEMMRGRHCRPGVSLDVNPSSRRTLQDLTLGGWTLDLLAAGARIHQAGCLGCIGMGQAPASGRASVRTMPRNFIGRSGTSDDLVYLCSPESAAAAALTGRITDPRDLAGRPLPYPRPGMPRRSRRDPGLIEAPLEPSDARSVELVKGSTIASIPELVPVTGELRAPVLLRLGDDVTTDDISPGGAEALPWRSNIPRLSEFTFRRVDPSYVDRTRHAARHGGHALVAGRNYGQGSSREHAALVLRYLGLRVVVAISYARIHWQNLVNYGILPLELDDPGDVARVSVDDLLRVPDPLSKPLPGPDLAVLNLTTGDVIACHHALNAQQLDVISAGGMLSWVRRQTAVRAGTQADPGNQ